MTPAIAKKAMPDLSDHDRTVVVGMLMLLGNVPPDREIDILAIVSKFVIEHDNPRFAPVRVACGIGI